MSSLTTIALPLHHDDHIRDLYNRHSYISLPLTEDYLGVLALVLEEHLWKVVVSVNGTCPPPCEGVIDICRYYLLDIDYPYHVTHQHRAAPLVEMMM